MRDNECRTASVERCGCSCRRSYGVGSRPWPRSRIGSTYELQGRFVLSRLAREIPQRGSPFFSIR